MSRAGKGEKDAPAATKPKKKSIMKRVAARFDADGDGKFTYKDILFKLDRDGDGKIGFGDVTAGAKRAVMKASKDMILNVIDALYMNKIKPRVLEDRFVPFIARKLVHDLVNELYENFMVELPSKLDSLIPQRRNNGNTTVKGEHAIDDSDDDTLSHLEEEDDPPREDKQFFSPPPSPPAAIDAARSEAIAPSAPPLPMLHALPSAPPPSALIDIRSTSPPPSPPAIGEEPSSSSAQEGSKSNPRSPLLSPVTKSTPGKCNARAGTTSPSKPSRGSFRLKKRSCAGLGAELVATADRDAAASVVQRHVRERALKQGVQKTQMRLADAAVLLTRKSKKKLHRRRHMDNVLAKTFVGKMKRAAFHFGFDQQFLEDLRHLRFRSAFSKLKFRRYMLKFRAVLLYHQNPYDRTFFGKLTMPVSLLLLTVTLWPGWLTRGVYFTVVFCFLYMELEEFQMMRFILLLKGTSAISGCIAAGKYISLFYCCSVLYPGTCVVQGPNAGANVIIDIVVMLWLQTLVYLAFLLLPFCKRLGSSDGILQEAQSAYQQMEEQSKKTPSSASSNIFRFLAPKPKPKVAKPLAANGKFAPAAAKRKPASPTFKQMPTSTLLEPSSKNVYKRLVDEEVGLPAVDLPEPKATPKQSALQTFLSQFDTDGDGDFDFDDLKNVLTQLLISNRLGLLLFWDMAMLTSCMMLFCSLMVTVSFTCDLSLWSMELWLGWQASTSFAICKMLYSLSSMPFAIFMIPSLCTLFSHTLPTGFDTKGNCVPVNTEGLSAYLCWVDFILRDNGPTKRRLEASLACEHSQALALKYRALLHAIGKAREVLAEIGNCAIDRNLMARQERKIVHLDRLFGQIVVEVTRLDEGQYDPAHHPIMYSLNPQKIIMYDYLMKLGKQGKLKGKLKRKYEDECKKVRQRELNAEDAAVEEASKASAASLLSKGSSSSKAPSTRSGLFTRKRSSNYSAKGGRNKSASFATTPEAYEA